VKLTTHLCQRPSIRRRGAYTSTLPHAFTQCNGLTLPLPLCCTHFISSMVALFIGSICSIWHSMLTTDLFRYSGMGKIPAIITVNSCHFLTENKNTRHTVKSVRLTIALCWSNAWIFPTVWKLWNTVRNKHMFHKAQVLNKTTILPLKFIIMVKMMLYLTQEQFSFHHTITTTNLNASTLRMLCTMNIHLWYTTVHNTVE